MEEVGEVKKKSKGKENRFGRRYGFEIKLRCVKMYLEEGLPLSLLSKEVGASTHIRTVLSIPINTYCRVARKNFTPRLSQVGSRTGAVPQGPFPVPTSSNPAYGSPIPGFPANFI